MEQLDLWTADVPVVNILGLVGYAVSATTIQLCHYSVAAAIDNT